MKPREEPDYASIEEAARLYRETTEKAHQVDTKTTSEKYVPFASLPSPRIPLTIRPPP